MTETATDTNTTNAPNMSAIPPDELARMTDDIVAALKTVYDPEIPVDIYELGLIYKVDIEDDRTAFAQLVGLTRPGGRIVITVPALMALYGARDEAQGHYRRYEKESLRALTEGHPVRVDELRYWNALGVGPTFVNQRLLGRAIDESFRYGKPGLVPRMLRRGLSLWFSQVENRISPPLGLTLLMVATRL